MAEKVLIALVILAGIVIIIPGLKALLFTLERDSYYLFDDDDDDFEIEEEEEKDS